MNRNLAAKARINKIMLRTSDAKYEKEKEYCINAILNEEENMKQSDKKYEQEKEYCTNAVVNQEENMKQSDTNCEQEKEYCINAEVNEEENKERLTIINEIIDSIIHNVFIEKDEFSSGSGDYYIPNSEIDSSDSSIFELRSKNKYKKSVTVYASSSTETFHSSCLEISSPDTQAHEAEQVISQQPLDEQVPTEDPGSSRQRNKIRKTRKSLKERREQRMQRLVSRNAGESYVTKLGKIKPGRNLTPLTDCRMKCNDRISQDVREFIFQEYWCLGSYDERAKYTERLIKLNVKKSNKVGATRHREFSNSYKLIYFSDEYKICKGCLLKTLGETNRFLQTICEKLQKYGRVTKSERGRAASYKKISAERLKEAEDHILKFPAYESHYSRSKTAKKYLSASLNLEEMYRLYTLENENPVSKTVYSKVFKDLNLSFKKPSIDTCNKCNLLQNKLKYLTEADQVVVVQDQLNKHQEDYESAYGEKRQDKLTAKSNEDTCVVAFDLQQCLPTPMLNTQSAFYKRQLWVFNLTVHDFMSNNAYCYMWPESSGGRGANQIASCLYDFISIRLPLLHPTSKHLIMYSDSCSGQNKNSIVTTALMLAIKDSQQLLTIEHKFLVPGHTHMEVDSDHALIERAKKKTSMNIHHPRDWCQLVRSASNRNNKFSVIEMDVNDFYDFANFTKKHLLVKKTNTTGQKFVWTDLRAMKFIKGEFPEFKYKTSFKDTDYYFMSYAKRNKNYDLVNVNTVQKCYDGPVAISAKKKADLISLLDYIDPTVHDFYHNLLTNDDLRDIDPDIATDDDE